MMVNQNQPGWWSRPLSSKKNGMGWLIWISLGMGIAMLMIGFAVWYSIQPLFSSPLPFPLSSHGPVPSIDGEWMTTIVFADNSGNKEVVLYFIEISGSNAHLTIAENTTQIVGVDIGTCKVIAYPFAIRSSASLQGNTLTGWGNAATFDGTHIISHRLLSDGTMESDVYGRVTTAQYNSMVSQVEKSMDCQQIYT